MKFFIANFALLILSISTSQASECRDLINFSTKKFAVTEHYQCQKSDGEMGAIFDEDLGSEGSIDVTESSACITLGYLEKNSKVPSVMVQDKTSGFEMLKLGNGGNSLYGSIFMAALIDENNKTVTRIDFDKTKKFAHLTKWKMGIFGNKMLYNYTVDCQKINN